MDVVDIGHDIIDREVIEETSEGVLIVPVTTDGKIILVEQSRHLFGTTFEVPSGAIGSGETPLQAAARELREEAGLEAMHFELISSHANSVHMVGRNYYFIANGLRSCERSECDSDEEFTGQAAFDFQEIGHLIKNDRIPDVRNRGCLWLAELRLLQRLIKGSTNSEYNHRDATG